MGKNKGITLVALVITIIVMLILVGVTITLAINRGLFDRAKDAKRGTDAAKSEEQRLANGRIKIGDNWYATMEDYINSKPIQTVTTGDYVGNFVQYDVAYTDTFYNTYQYTNKNGWRILRYETTGETIDDKDIITNVEIISTGIPARLYYRYDDTSTNKDEWWDSSGYGIETFRTALKNYWDGTTEYPLYNNNDLTSVNLKASAGMYNKFGGIEFTKGNTSSGQTGYTAITTGGTSMTGTKTGGELFLTGNANKVRLLTLPEINNAIGKSAINEWNYTISDSEEPAPGLFKLDQLTGLTGYTYNDGYYWLASPYSSSSSGVHGVNCYGCVSNNYNISRGARPVVSLGSDIRYSVEEKSDNGFSYLVLSKVSAE
ncbi:MAG: hypothetical protein Q4G05_06085 [Clostridia bacterium]|nr:hypothetical protein [Clostridia bacterium]